MKSSIHHHPLKFDFQDFWLFSQSKLGLKLPTALGGIMTDITSDCTEASEIISGFHEDFDVVYDDPPVESQSERSFDDQDEEIKYESLRQSYGHLEWHCYVYRTAIQRVPSAAKEVRKVMQELGERKEPLCSGCEKDDLLTEIAALKKKVQELEAELKVSISSEQPSSCVQE
ncbi:hypothetical protein FOCC_FOCC002843 [Frankliniella occidentalis]|uniref:Uncharacterized protein LOC113201763 n=1 Tax=Frankliniella occidentalis TaxID=133901 RepID=A0A6J1RR58_FRAOC|nr:uncharacterized protein LOC113201763 [Frankliniella occidentalis]KAE8750549.1 hypothetical protein FOCC_FOCC002843 [Frankliniella occidentalis]